MQKKTFLLLKKLKNTSSAQLWLEHFRDVFIILQKSQNI